MMHEWNRRTLVAGLKRLLVKLRVTRHQESFTRSLITEDGYRVEVERFGTGPLFLSVSHREDQVQAALSLRQSRRLARFLAQADE
ncbi:MAG TPA: hypothetical protein VNA57_08065 [Acidimicrobiales bacterium]|nr:hypothetical protein [Acidimicrobiales bacterium]